MFRLLGLQHRRDAINRVSSTVNDISEIKHQQLHKREL